MAFPGQACRIDYASCVGQPVAERSSRRHEAARLSFNIELAPKTGHIGRSA